jgi:hypothetical protein
MGSGAVLLYRSPIAQTGYNDTQIVGSFAGR